MQKAVLVSVALLILTLSLEAQTVKEPTGLNEEWSKPYPPFRIVGNLYYVGTYDLACYLITTKEGNILINTGLASSADQIKKSIETLGFKLTDTKILLTTQAHYDHVGAMAAIKKRTNAKLIANEKEVSVLEDGGISDYEMGGANPTFEPIKVDSAVGDNAQISLGGMVITLMSSPGHTKGSSSYSFKVKDGYQSHEVFIVNMPTIISSRKFSEITSYPTIAADFQATLTKLRMLTPDLWVSSHASQFDLHKKHKPGDKYHPMAFQDVDGYNAQLKRLQLAYDEKMK